MLTNRLTLVIGSKNSSSWSLRPWLLLKMAEISFDEIVIHFNTPTTKRDILHHSPSGKVPALRVGEQTIWESLAICEFIAEQFKEAHLWPKDAMARALARSISAEMHSGFIPLRKHMPMNISARLPGEGMAEGVQASIERIEYIWLDCLNRYADDGDFLFGHFTVADAMFAPVVSRFKTYDVKLPSRAQAYADAIWNLPAMQEWVFAAGKEAPVACTLPAPKKP